MTFNDIFKSAFLEAFSTSNISLSLIAKCLIISALLGTYLFFFYQFITKKTFYDKAFNMSIPVLAVLVCAVILTIQSNIVMSLGMVGALSIVRFRTAIKSSMDLIFLFWATAIGIICGANLHIIAIVMTSAVTAGLLIMDFLPVAKAPVLLVINATDRAAAEEIESVVKKLAKRYHIKSQTIETNRLDMIIEVSSKENAKIMSEIAAIDTVTRCSLVNHDGEVTF